MIDLLTGYSLSQIAIFAVCSLLAVKGGWDLVDFFKGKVKDLFLKDYDKLKKEEELQAHYKISKAQHEETMQQYEKLDEKLDDIVVSIDEINDRVDILSKNDQHTIKQIIVKDYHYFMRKGCIDDFSLDAILLLYEDYKKLGGNSYVESLIDELKKLPHEETK